MASLLFNFFKRAIIVPVVVTAIVIGAIYLYVPSLITDGQSRATEETAAVDLSQFSVKEYNSFRELKSGDYIGTVSCSSVELGETPVVYIANNEKAVYAINGSAEPWNGGSMVIIGNDVYSQFAKLYNSEKGDYVSLKFYSGNTYDYKIEKKVTGVTENELKNYLVDGQLVLAVPYNDFSNLGNSFFYTLYVARKA